MRRLLVCLLDLGGRLGAQPQRHVCGLHGLPDYTFQITAQRFEIRLVPELGREGFQGLLCVVLPAVEAAVDEGLDAPTHRVEERRYREGGDHHGQLRLLLLSGEEAENCLYRRHAPEVDGEKRRRQRTVDEGAVDDEVYVVEAVLEDGDAHSERYTQQGEKLQQSNYQKQALGPLVVRVG